jgi:hypothetical protein
MARSGFGARRTALDVLAGCADSGRADLIIVDRNKPTLPWFDPITSSAMGDTYPASRIDS